MLRFFPSIILSAGWELETLCGEDCLLRGQGPGGWCHAWRAQGQRLGHPNVTAGNLIENVKVFPSIILSAGWELEVLRDESGLLWGRVPGSWCCA